MSDNIADITASLIYKDEAQKEKTNSQNFTQEQCEILTGLMLGDGSLEMVSKKKARLRLERKSTDIEYLKYHQRIFQEYISDKGFSYRENYNKKRDKTYYSVRLKTLSNIRFAELHNIWYVNNIKIVPDIKLTSKIIAIWFMDDGSVNLLNTNYLRIQFYTDSFSELEVEKLHKLLSEYYNINIIISARRGKNTIQYHLEICKQKDVKIILNDIEPFVEIGLPRKSNIWKSFYTSLNVLELL